ncbi:MAG: hypothetical protein ABIB71_06825 [Candidatus Woesearchaeota archaeon]
MSARKKRIKKFCKPLTGLPDVIALWVCGLSGKGRVDGVVLLDDTKKFLSLSAIKSVDDGIARAEAKASTARIKLKFRPAKCLTLWWDMLRQGEPGTITLLSDATILYDSTGLASMMLQLVDGGKIYRLEEKAKRLIARAKSSLEQAEDILLIRAPQEAYLSMVESAQAVFMYYGRQPPKPADIAKELRDTFVAQKLLREDVADIYEDVHTFMGHEGGVTGKNVEYLTLKAKRVMFEMEELISRLEREKNSSELEDSYMEVLRLCDKALRQESTSIPKPEEERIMLFKKLFIDTGKIADVHFRTFKELYMYSKARRKERSELSNERYLNGVHVSALKLAVMETIKK